jgi:hypothetical protein
VQARLRERAAGSPFEQVLRLEGPDEEERHGVDPSGKPCHVGAWVTPESPDGVILAQGGGSYGYSLYLRDAKPCFALRNEGALTEIMAPEALVMGEKVHLIGSLDHVSYVHVYVNGVHAGAMPAPILAAKPAEPLTVGRDSAGAVGNYEGENPFSGTLTDIRVYTGVITVDDIDDWIGR